MGCRCRVVVSPSQRIAFLTFSLPSPSYSWHLNLPNDDDDGGGGGSNGNDDDDGGGAGEGFFTIIMEEEKEERRCVYHSF